jgi:hypothetical protein
MIGKILRKITIKKRLTYCQMASDEALDLENVYRSLMNGANHDWEVIEKLLTDLG